LIGIGATSTLPQEPLFNPVRVQEIVHDEVRALHTNRRE
jgi:hypothetical protein